MPLQHYYATSFSFDGFDFKEVLTRAKKVPIPLEINGKLVHLKIVDMPTESDMRDHEMCKKAYNAVLIEKAVLNGLCRSSHTFLLQYLGFVEVFLHTGRKCIFLSEFVDGVTFKRWNKKEQLISFSLRLEVTQQTCEALKHVHSCGYAHNDISSNNLMISASGHVSLIDFGAAKASGTCTCWVICFKNFMCVHYCSVCHIVLHRI